MKNLLKLSLLLSVIAASSTHPMMKPDLSMGSPDQIVVIVDGEQAAGNPIIDRKEVKFGRSIILPANESGVLPIVLKGKTYQLTFNPRHGQKAREEVAVVDRYVYRMQDIVSGKKNAAGKTWIFDADIAYFKPVSAQVVEQLNKYQRQQ